MARDPYSLDNRSAYEHTDESGTQDHIAQEYNTQVDEFNNSDSVGAVSNCEVCGDAIPPTRARCNTHQRDTPSSRSVDDQWSISRVAIAVVPGTTYYHAVSLGAAAFRHRNQQSNSPDSFDLIYDFDDEPSRTLVREWSGELPDAVRLDSEQGTELYKTGIRKTPTLSVYSLTGNSHQESAQKVSDDSDVYIYLEDGTPVQIDADIETIENIRSDSDQPLWVVTAVLYQRTTRRSTADQNDTRRMFCQQCAETTHIYRGSLACGEWECTSCGTTRDGQPPGAYDMDPYPAEKGRSPEEEWFQQLMKELYEAGELQQ